MNLEQWAMTHETAFEIAEAIAEMAEGDSNRMEQIWQEPTLEETCYVWNHATKHGLIDDRELDWGVMSLHAVMDQF